MNVTFEFLPTLVFVIVMICWFVFAGIFLLRKKPPAPPDEKRAPESFDWRRVAGNLLRSSLGSAPRSVYADPVQHFRRDRGRRTGELCCDWFGLVGDGRSEDSRQRVEPDGAVG